MYVHVHIKFLTCRKYYSVCICSTCTINGNISLKLHCTLLIILFFFSLSLLLFLSPLFSDDQNMETVMKNLDQQYATLNMVSMISRYGTEQQGANARDAELLTRERLCRALSMFELVMQRIKSFLTCDPVSILIIY